MDKELSQKLKIKGSGLSFGGASIKEKVLFTRNLAIMLRSGLSINESLEILASQAKGGFKSAINNIIKIISAGSSIADSLALYPRFFSSFYIQTIKAGETSGNLENNLHQLATRMEKEREFRDKIKSAMFYPLVVLVLSIVVALTMSLVVLPKITPIFKGLKIKLPVATLFLIAFSDFMKSYGWLVVMGIIAATFILFWFSRLKFFHPLTHYIFLHIPLIAKFSHSKNTAIFCQTLGVLIKSGLSIDEALRITQDTVENYYYKKIIKETKEKVSQGKKLSDCLADYEKYFSEMSTGMIRVGERSGNLEEQLITVGEIYEKEIEGSIKLLAAALEPALLIIIGLIVGGLALAIITPIYKITGNIYR